MLGFKVERADAKELSFLTIPRVPKLELFSQIYFCAATKVIRIFEIYIILMIALVFLGLKVGIWPVSKDGSLSHLSRTPVLH